MNVHLHIERIVLDGLPVEATHGGAVRAAVEAELTRLLTEEGVGPGLRRGGAFAHVRGGDLRPVEGASPDRLGEGIARAVYRGLER